MFSLPRLRCLLKLWFWCCFISYRNMGYPQFFHFQYWSFFDKRGEFNWNKGIILFTKRLEIVDVDLFTSIRLFISHSIKYIVISCLSAINLKIIMIFSLAFLANLYILFTIFFNFLLWPYEAFCSGHRVTYTASIMHFNSCLFLFISCKIVSFVIVIVINYSIVPIWL